MDGNETQKLTSDSAKNITSIFIIMSTNRFSEKQKEAPTQHKHAVLLICHLVFLHQIILKVNSKCRLTKPGRYCRGEFQQSFSNHKSTALLSRHRCSFQKYFSYDIHSARISSPGQKLPFSSTSCRTFWIACVSNASWCLHSVKRVLHFLLQLL